MVRVREGSGRLEIVGGLPDFVQAGVLLDAVLVENPIVEALLEILRLRPLVTALRLLLDFASLDLPSSASRWQKIPSHQGL